MQRKLFLFLFFLMPLSILAQKVKFQHFTDDEKFGLGNVWAIIEDSNGFIWFGTQDGLYKYDGYEIFTYRHNKNDSTSIGGNFIISLYEDSSQNLWIGSFGDGLSLYNRDKNNFVNFRHDPDNPNSLPNDRVKTITEASDGSLYFGTEGGGMGIFKPDSGKINPDKVKFEVINHSSSPISLTSDFIRSIVIDENNKAYIGTMSGGLNIYDPSSKRIEAYRYVENRPTSIVSDQISSLFIDSKKRIWVGSFDAGLDLFDPESKEFIHYRSDTSQHTLNDNEIEALREDRFGNIWVGTDNGLSRFVNSENLIPANEFINYLHEPLDPYSLLSNAVKTIYFDSKGSMWVGTYFGGINVNNDILFKFNPIRRKSWLRTNLSHDNVTAFAEDKHGNLWIGTDGGGLNLLHDGVKNPFGDDYESIKLINPVTNTLESKVKAIQIDGDGNLWVGFWAGGLFKYNPYSKSREFIGPENLITSEFRANNVEALAMDQNNNIWAGSYSKGISRINYKNGEIKTYLPVPNNIDSVSSDRVRCVLVDSKNRIWAGGDLNHLFLFDPEKDKFVPVPYTKNIIIVSLKESADGNIWMGTVSSGLISYNPEKQEFISYTEDDGLPGSSFNAILEDNTGKLWVSSGDGLMVFNPSTADLMNYYKSDGLQGNHFNQGSALKLSNGNMLFGGATGWNTISPEQVKIDTTKPKIAFTNFWLDDKLMNVNIEGSPLDININLAEKIDLNYDQNSFTIEFAALEYDFVDKNEYQYLLEGFNSDWQSLGNDRKATFTNLNPRTYRLRVKANNHDGVWSEREKDLIITIHPAWWQTPAFKFAVLFLLILVAWSIYRLRMKILINQSRKLELEVQLRTKELKTKNLELDVKNNEIQSQNEELIAQNEHIVVQKNKLESAQNELKEINEHLERMVDSRTKKLKTTIKKLDKTVRELDRFVYSASHDLSAPLKSIRGLIQIAKLKEDYGSITECLNYMENSVARLEDVIQSLVEYSRNSHLELKEEPVNIHDIVSEVVNDLAFWPEAKKVVIENNLDPQHIIQTDKARLKIVLHNLISNGIKYADFSKESSYIRIECKPEDDYCVLSLKDNGIGIDREHVNAIFNMYFRASEQSEGSGLGLFIVSEIINKLQGKIRVESEKGRGTTFYLNLPVHTNIKDLQKVKA